MDCRLQIGDLSADRQVADFDYSGSILNGYEKKIAHKRAFLSSVNFHLSSLLHYLEFTGFYQFAAFIGKVKDVQAAIIIITQGKGKLGA